MSKKTYRVLNGLEFPTDTAIVERIKAGEYVPYGQRGILRVEVGDITADIPETSVGWLLKQGHIEEVPDGTVRAS